MSSDPMNNDPFNRDPMRRQRSRVVFGIFIIPMLYVVFQQLRERVSGAPKLASSDSAGAPAAGE